MYFEIFYVYLFLFYYFTVCSFNKKIIQKIYLYSENFLLWRASPYLHYVGVRYIRLYSTKRFSFIRKSYVIMILDRTELDWMKRYCTIKLYQLNWNNVIIIEANINKRISIKPILSTKSNLTYSTRWKIN